MRKKKWKRKKDEKLEDENAAVEKFGERRRMNRRNFRNGVNTARVHLHNKVRIH